MSEEVIKYRVGRALKTGHMESNEVVPRDDVRDTITMLGDLQTQNQHGNTNYKHGQPQVTKFLCQNISQFLILSQINFTKRIPSKILNYAIQFDKLNFRS